MIPPWRDDVRLKYIFLCGARHGRGWAPDAADFHAELKPTAVEAHQQRWPGAQK